MLLRAAAAVHEVDASHAVWVGAAEVEEENAVEILYEAGTVALVAILLCYLFQLTRADK